VTADVRERRTEKCNLRTDLKSQHLWMLSQRKKSDDKTLTFYSEAPLDYVTHHNWAANLILPA
jgi:hypothetical protein